MRKIIKENHHFERLEIKIEEAVEMFKHNKFKLWIIDNHFKTPTVPVYRCGPLIDVCYRPHVKRTGLLKSFTLFNNSSSHWEGEPANVSLQRVYG